MAAWRVNNRTNYPDGVWIILLLTVLETRNRRIATPHVSVFGTECCRFKSCRDIDKWQMGPDDERGYYDPNAS